MLFVDIDLSFMQAKVFSSCASESETLSSTTPQIPENGGSLSFNKFKIHLWWQK